MTSSVPPCRPSPMAPLARALSLLRASLWRGCPSVPLGGAQYPEASHQQRVSVDLPHPLPHLSSPLPPSLLQTLLLLRDAGLHGIHRQQPNSHEGFSAMAGGQGGGTGRVARHSSNDKLHLEGGGRQGKRPRREGGRRGVGEASGRVRHS